MLKKMDTAFRSDVTVASAPEAPVASIRAKKYPQSLSPVALRISRPKNRTTARRPSPTRHVMRTGGGSGMSRIARTMFRLLTRQDEKTTVRKVRATPRE